ncbi:MAG: LysR family transcriptional regulator [Beijerinckiaceae bacterium]|nr:LysR family transcriptional regulator [Beijerinckiaceae bacterium]
MEMHQVRYFLAVCNELNFTRAAQFCNVSQPSLTRAIKLLEHEFGGALLHRERSNTHLTELGRVVLPYLQDVWDKADAAKRLAVELKQSAKIRLKLGIMCTIAPTNLIDLLSAVRVRHPDIELEILDSPAESLQAMLLEGSIEVAIYCQPEQEPDPRINCVGLFREQMYVVLPPGHRLAQKRAITVADLAGERYVLRTQCEHNACIDGFFLGAGINCPTAYRSDRDDWVLAMVASGLGFGMMGRNSIVHSGVLARPLVEPELWRVINIATVRGRPHSSAVGALVHEAVRTHWAGEPALSIKARDSLSADEADFSKADAVH